MSQPPIIMMYLEAGAYIAIMLAVIGVPQMLSSYFDIRDRRRERDELRAENERIRLEQEANAERIRLEQEANAERIRLEQEANAERIRLEQEANAERRHQEMMAMLAALMSHNAASRANDDQNDLIRAQQYLIADLTAEVAALRQARTDGDNGA